MFNYSSYSGNISLKIQFKRDLVIIIMTPDTFHDLLQSVPEQK